jgi:hypothetical protein
MTVYVLQCKQTHNIKIGYTASQVRLRLKELKTASSTPLELVKCYPGLTEGHEHQLHGILGRYRVTGEWFNSDALLLIDDAAESLFATGEKDLDCLFQGKRVHSEVMTLKIAVLALNTQNLKKSIFEQIPLWDKPFHDLFSLEGDRVKIMAKVWGKVEIPVKRYGNDTAEKSVFLFLEYDEEPFRFSLCGHKVENLYWRITERSWEQVLPTHKVAYENLSDRLNQFPQLYLAA